MSQGYFGEEVDPLRPDVSEKTVEQDQLRYEQAINLLKSSLSLLKGFEQTSIRDRNRYHLAGHHLIDVVDAAKRTHDLVGRLVELLAEDLTERIHASGK